MFPVGEAAGNMDFQFISHLRMAKLYEVLHAKREGFKPSLFLIPFRHFTY